MMTTLHLRSLVALLSVCGFSAATAATPLPLWYGDDGTTRQGYLFTSGVVNPTPEILESPYGMPTATVAVGGFSDGWQDPASEFDLTGVLEDGAWDLGIAGTITVMLEAAQDPPPPGTFYRIDFQVYAVSYLGITALPTLDTLGLTAGDLTITQSFVAVDPLFPGASWQGLTWTGFYDNMDTNLISFAVKAPFNNTSVVDTYEVFTRVTLVPEPSSALMFMASLMAWTLRRSRV